MAEAKANVVKQINPGEQPQQKPVKALTGADYWLSELSQNSFFGKAPSGSRPEQLDQNLAFWSQFSRDAKQFDTIWLASEDRAWVANFIVLATGLGQCVVKLIQYFEVPKLGLAGQPKPIPDGWTIEPAAIGEGDGSGFVHVRLVNPNPLADDNKPRRFMNNGIPYRSYQEAYEELLKKAIFTNPNQAPRYTA